VKKKWGKTGKAWRAVRLPCKADPQWRKGERRLRRSTPDYHVVNGKLSKAVGESLNQTDCLRSPTSPRRVLCPPPPGMGLLWHPWHTQSVAEKSLWNSWSGCKSSEGCQSTATGFPLNCIIIWRPVKWIPVVCTSGPLLTLQPSLEQLQN
jgi:hypothetical protein